MTLGKALQWATNTFSTHDIDESHIEARVLLGYVLKLSSAEIYTQIDQSLSQSQLKSFKQLVNRRLRREPTAYIINNKEFYGIDFYVDQRVLIPRPETELLVEEAVHFVNDRENNPAYPDSPVIIADIGTGCGAVAVSLAILLPDINVIATDISRPALEVAQYNSQHHQVEKQITFLHGNLLDTLSKPVDLIVANLPYIASSDLANLTPEIREFEPLIATDGGDRGIDYIHQLLAQVKDKVRNNGCLLMEIGQGQEEQLYPIIDKYVPGAQIELVQDLARINRVIKVNF
jgi:release factor glutamine methyltransferase